MEIKKDVVGHPVNSSRKEGCLAAFDWCTKRSLGRYVPLESGSEAQVSLVRPTTQQVPELVVCICGESEQSGIHKNKISLIISLKTKIKLTSHH